MFFSADTLSHFHFILIIRQIKVFISPTKKLNTAKVCFCNFVIRLTTDIITIIIIFSVYTMNVSKKLILVLTLALTTIGSNALFNLKKAIGGAAKAVQAVTLTDEQMAAYVKKIRLRLPYRKISPLNISLIYNATDSLHGRRLFCFKDSTDIRI